MAAVDALLNLVIEQGAQTLTLVGGEVPQLSKAGVPKALSMPPLPAETLHRFVEEVRAVSEDRCYVLASRGARVAFDVEIQGDDRIEFRVVEGQAAATSPQRSPDVAGSAASVEQAGRSPEPPSVPPAGMSANDESVEVPRSLQAGPLHDDVPSEATAAEVAAVESLIAQALAAEATDLFISSSADARVRVGRRLKELPATQCAPRAILGLFGLDDGQRLQLETHGSIDVSLNVAGGRVRANLFRHQGGVAAAIRPIRPVRSLVELGLPGDLSALTRYADGLVLMVGPAGSGKSTTLAALIDDLNRSRACHVVTLEDPIEVEYDNGRCLIHQREVGRHVESFASGLRAALRESPDVILLGEMRDPETIAAALTAAETGHLVLATLHSGSAAMAIDRIIDAFPPHQHAQIRLQLAGVLRAVVTQVLLPAARGGGLVPALEKMIVSHAVAHSIRESRGHQIANHIQTGRIEGMVSLELSLAELVRRRAITRDTAAAAARNPDLLDKLLCG